MMNISKTSSVLDLQKLAREGGRIRYAKSRLYTVGNRSPNPFNRAVESLTGLTTTKRRLVLGVIAEVCNKNGVDFKEALQNAGLPADELAKLLSYKGDLKAEHLNAALAKFVQVGDLAFKIEEDLGQGGNGKVVLATNGSKRIALKQAIKIPGDETMKQTNREADVHAFVHQTKLGTKSHVVPTYGIVEGADGTQYQAMDVAIADGGKLVELQRKKARTRTLFGNRNGPLTPEKLQTLVENRPPLTQRLLDTSAENPTLKLVVSDMLDGLRQTEEAGIAHRDIKLQNYLVNDRGEVQLTDFGTSGDSRDLFGATKGIPVAMRTGNENDNQKSPEWVRSELKVGSPAYQVGHGDDVFSLGVAAYGLITGGRLPFHGKPGDPDAPIAPFDYRANLLDDYAVSTMSFSEWHKQHTGIAIPDEWKPLLNGALNPGPQQRPSADELRKLDLFTSGLDITKTRETMVRQLNATQH